MNRSQTAGAAVQEVRPTEAAPVRPVGDFAARVLRLRQGTYVVALAGGGAPVPALGLPLPAAQLCALPEHAGVEIKDERGRPASWLGGPNRRLFVSIGSPEEAIVVSGYLARGPNAEPLRLEIRAVATAPASRAPLTAQPTMALRLDREEPAGPIALDVVAHIRGRGDVRFLDAPWTGRIGPGQWIEAFAVFPRNRTVAAAVEYKGLMANGDETPWLACGALCGTRGRGLPLIGFAVRQKAGTTGLRIDCEYSGYFQSGMTSGPARNGAPCRSERENDALEGFQLRIIPRTPSGGSRTAA